MKEFIRKWSNWWILNPKRKQLDDAFEKELNELIEREAALRIHDVVGLSEQLLAYTEWLKKEGLLNATVSKLIVKKHQSKQLRKT